MKYVLVFERALESAFCIGTFDSKDAAEAYAQKHHGFPQVWRTVELRTPDEAAKERT